MRLIDADKLMEDFRNTITEKSDTMDWLNMIYRQPTAYDIGKVVDEFEEWSFEAKILVPNNNELGEYEEEVERKIICTQNAIEIVKHGGVADDVCEKR